MRTRGEVKYYNDKKGIGIITPFDGSKDCFVERATFRGEGFTTLSRGVEVEFTIIQEQKGPVATDVTLYG